MVGQEYTSQRHKCHDDQKGNVSCNNTYRHQGRTTDDGKPVPKGQRTDFLICFT